MQQKQLQDRNVYIPVDMYIWLYDWTKNFWSFQSRKQNSEHLKSLLVAESPVRNLHGFGCRTDFNEWQLDVKQTEDYCVELEYSCLFITWKSLTHQSSMKIE